MKEIKIHLDTPQMLFLEKVISKIEASRFKVYGTSSIGALRIILDRGWYSHNQVGWLNSIRRDYLEVFCR